MSIIVFLVLGALVGWAAAELMGRHEGLLASIVIGIVGSFIGSWISELFTGSDRSYLTLSWVGIFWSFIGAVVLVGILNMFSHRHTNDVMR